MDREEPKFAKIVPPIFWNSIFETGKFAYADYSGYRLRVQVQFWATSPRVDNHVPSTGGGGAQTPIRHPVHPLRLIRERVKQTCATAKVSANVLALVSNRSPVVSFWLRYAKPYACWDAKMSPPGGRCSFAAREPLTGQTNHQRTPPKCGRVVVKETR